MGLLTIEELLRSGREMPSEELREEWCKGRLVDGHLAIITTYVGIIKGITPSMNMIILLEDINLPKNDSIIRRVMHKIIENKP